MHWLDVSQAWPLSNDRLATVSMVNDVDFQVGALWWVQGPRSLAVWRSDDVISYVLYVSDMVRPPRM